MNRDQKIIFICSAILVGASVGAIIYLLAFWF